MSNHNELLFCLRGARIAALEFGESRPTHIDNALAHIEAARQEVIAHAARTGVEIREWKPETATPAVVAESAVETDPADSGGSKEL